MQRTVAGISMWSVWQPDRNLPFNSFFVPLADGNLVVDPLVLSAEDAAEIESAGGIAWIAITNRDHERDARTLAARFGAKIAASEGDAALLSAAPDRVLAEGDRLGDATVLALHGLKTPGEFALHFPQRRTAISGDALWGDPAGSLRLMPAEKLADADAAARSLRRIAALELDSLLVGDGACVFANVRQTIWGALRARTSAAVGRINLDELMWKASATAPDGWKTSDAEVGYLIGAERLGYRVAQIGAGQTWSPYHWHSAEEEVFVVLEGAPTLQTPDGEFVLRKGDFVAFPTGPAGAHKIRNDGAQTALVFMLSNVDGDDVCYYPHSRKMLVEATDLLVRDNPELDYWEGER